MEAAITITGLDAVQRKLMQLPTQSATATRRALTKCALTAQKYAVWNAPISPKQEQVNKAMTMWRPVSATTLKRKVKGQWVYRDRNRKADASSRAMPGGLEKSIEAFSDGKEACVFVARNSHAGAYAAVIHDKRHHKPGWSELGTGSKAKSPRKGRVGEKFIERAIFENKDEYHKIIDTEIRKEINKR